MANSRRVPYFKRTLKCGYCGHVAAKYLKRVQKDKEFYRLYICHSCRHWTMISLEALALFSSPPPRDQSSLDQWR